MSQIDELLDTGQRDRKKRWPIGNTGIWQADSATQQGQGLTAVKPSFRRFF